MLRLAIYSVGVVILTSNTLAQKPTVPAPLFADYWNVPQTIGGFMAASHAVVIGSITAVDESSANRKARTVYRAKALTTLKEHHNLSGDFEVCRAIGTEEMPDKIVRYYEPHLPAFSTASEYLLFLRWDERTRCFWPMFGPPSVGVFDRNGVFSSFTKHPALRSVDGLPREAVIAALVASRMP